MGFRGSVVLGLQFSYPITLSVQGSLSLVDGALQDGLLIDQTFFGESLQGSLCLLELHAAELALIVLPFRARVIKHGPNHGEQKERAGKQEPAIHGREVIESVAAISHVV